ncbi:hypothetical protein QJS10_CPB14g01463 [Acorus calamus]|uniref:Uncharacterized protein n=1 Tax=Acorus calamus TaxID=4465 RepID=A0AAV9DCB2_ACOCL|nr:hypothetical protein QJS10_CPB14g01463 [Acorus calamus]
MDTDPTGNPCLDFFFHVVPDTPHETLISLLDSAWTHDPLKALKLICHLRAVRGTGKSDKESFYSAALWLHDHHPKTLSLNIAAIAAFGYMKDLPEILHRILNGPDVRKNPDSSETRLEKRATAAAKAIERYARDPNYRSLHDAVCEFFAGALTADLERLRSGKLNEIGLSAKWCPSLASSFDRSTLLCDGIAKRVFGRESAPEYADIEESHYVYRVRARLRREVLVPLRAALELPEVYVTAKNWGSVPYERVASVGMKRHREAFKKHDGERFGAYVESVKKGEKRIAAGALLPHEILAGEAHDEVAELQWRRLVSELLEKGKLRNCIAVCGMSRLKVGTKVRDVGVAMGMLVAELSEEPWKGQVITFGDRPQLRRIEGETIAEKMSSLKQMERVTKADLRAVFEQILEVAVEGGLEAERMIKRVFVFSDVEFDEASVRPWETDYMAIKGMYEEKGYAVPEIVFWNLRHSRATPVTSLEKGVALVSGFSKNMLKVFLEGDGVIDPVLIMDAAIAGEEYSELVVFD